jgi:hypothetical protein
MVRRALVVVCFGFMVLALASCGQTYELQSITATPTSAVLFGSGATQALAITAHYSNGKSHDVTTQASYQLAIPATETGNSLYSLKAVTVNKSGMVEIVGVTCTWTAVPNTSGTATTYAYGTDPYLLTVTYEENSHTATAIVPVSANNAVGVCYDGTNTTHP